MVFRVGSFMGLIHLHHPRLFFCSSDVIPWLLATSMRRNMANISAFQHASWGQILILFHLMQHQFKASMHWCHAIGSDSKMSHSSSHTQLHGSKSPRLIWGQPRMIFRSYKNWRGRPSASSPHNPPRYCHHPWERSFHPQPLALWASSHLQGTSQEQMTSSWESKFGHKFNSGEGQRARRGCSLSCPVVFS